MATGLINEVALLTKIKSIEYYRDLSGPGHYNKVATKFLSTSQYIKCINHNEQNIRVLVKESANDKTLVSSFTMARRVYCLVS